MCNSIAFLTKSVSRWADRQELAMLITIWIRVAHVFRELVYSCLHYYSYVADSGKLTKTITINQNFMYDTQIHIKYYKTLNDIAYELKYASDLCSRIINIFKCRTRNSFRIYLVLSHIHFVFFPDLFNHMAVFQSNLEAWTRNSFRRRKTNSQIIHYFIWILRSNTSWNENLLQHCTC